MTAKTSNTDVLKGIYELTRANFHACWDDVVADLKPLFVARMAHKRTNHPLKAVINLVRHMEREKQDPSLIIAVGYHLCSEVQRRKGL
jgi:hypothetical protein